MNLEENTQKLSLFNPFHMRNRNLNNFELNTSTYRLNHYKNIINRSKIGTCTSASKSLDLLRSNLQGCINVEINNIIQKYMKKYFLPAIDNVKQNNGENSVSDHHIQAIFRQILEEAKKMYIVNNSSLIITNNPERKKADFKKIFENENNSNINNKKLSNKKISELKKKNLKLIGNETQNIRENILKKKKQGYAGRGRPPLNRISRDHEQISLGSDNLNPDRLTIETKFVLGSKANKALGFGATRGRLYTKHTDLFRYIGDQEDKQWLHEHGLMPLSGARAYILIKDDIEKLLNSKEYLNSPGINAQDMGEGFTLPLMIINKMKKLMENSKKAEIKYTYENKNNKEEFDTSSDQLEENELNQKNDNCLPFLES